MKIMLINGSLGGKSRTLSLMQYVEKLLEAKNVDTIFWDLGEKPLPIAVPRYHYLPDQNPSPVVREFSDAVSMSDGFVLSSPLYHGSFSGVLKNALDSLPPKAFTARPVTLLSHSSNARSCVAPCDSLRPVIRSLKGHCLPTQTGTTDEDYTDASGAFVLTDSRVKTRLKGQVEDLVRMAALFKKPL